MNYNRHATDVHNLEFSIYGTDYLENAIFVDALIGVMKTQTKLLAKKVHVVVYQNCGGYRLVKENFDTIYIYIDIKTSRLQKLVETELTYEDPKILIVVNDMEKKLELYKTLKNLPYKLPNLTKLKLEDSLFLDLHKALAKATLSDYTRDLLTIEGIYLPDFIYRLSGSFNPIHPIDKILEDSMNNPELFNKKMKILIQTILGNDNIDKYPCYNITDKLSPEMVKYINIFNQVVG